MTLSPLRILAVLLVTSAVMRGANPDIFASAQETSSPDGSEAQVLEIPFLPENLDRILNAFTIREANLMEAEAELESRRSVLNRTRSDLDEKILELEQVEQRLKATLTLSDTGAEDDIEKLASVYGSMKPKDAAELFAVMTPNFAAGFLSRMQPDAAAAIMSELDPEIGHTISVIFAGRNATASQD